MQGKNNGEEENRVKKTEDSSYSLLSHFWSTFQSPFSTCYIPFQSSRSQESKASNRVRFGAEMRKIWLRKTTAPGLCENFAQPPSKFAQPCVFLKVWMLCDGLDASHGNFSHPEGSYLYELLEGEVFNSKFCINPLEPISMAIESGGRLVKLETPHNKELELSLNIMEATPEDQHSHHGHQDNPNEFRSMRDHASTSYECTIMYSAPYRAASDQTHIVPLLPTFHGWKDKAKIWLNSLRPRSIRTWTDLQAEFLKKFFPTHRTNGLKRQISNFSAKENEKFYECWERYMEAINACPHHGFDTWLLRRSGKDEVSTNAFNAKAGMYTLNEDDDMKAKFAAMTRRLEELELKKMHEVQAVAETPVQVKLVLFVNLMNTWWRSALQFQLLREMFGDQANVVGQFKPNNNARMEILTTQVGGIIQISHGSQSTVPTAGSTISTIFKLTNLNTVQEKGRFPSQPHQNPKGIHEVETHEGESSQVRDVKALITLRSVMIGGKVVEKALLDLGASVNLLPYSVYKQLGLGELKPTSITLSLADRSVKFQGAITPEEEEGPEEVGGEEEILPLFNKEKEKLHQEKCLLEVLKRCKKAIGWQISDLKGISPLVCTHHIYMEEEAKPIRQPQRRLNPHLQEVVRTEVLKLLQAGIIYPYLTALGSEKTTFTCPFGTYAYRRMPFGLCNAPATFQRCMLSIFSDMVERIMEVFMDDITVYGGIVLGHIISEKGIEVDKAKVELIVKLPSQHCKGVRQFLAMQGAVLGQREDGKPYVIYYASKH
ncbi:hypothetical protein CK203_061091 [Vitis vinifera]|uniref:Uncharacterized protein n=1 Tax=Vitis vinifera TaxID=29760 RepID=A0A438G9X2_VITVI|nr:hypothetical protein CK203_061091 [Vitis vinifera]